MITVDETIRRLNWIQSTTELPTPSYRPPALEPRSLGHAVGFAVLSMRNHMTDEGWQLFKALEAAGYLLAGLGLPIADTDISSVIRRYDLDTVVLQDKREWEGRTAGPGFDKKESFSHQEILQDRPDVFKLTVLKDAQHNPVYHRESAAEIGCHAWIIYYHSKIVKHLAPFVRERHLIRTYHTVDSMIVPELSRHVGRKLDKAVLSGAISNAYPLRKRLVHNRPSNVDYLPHPGYGRNRCHTPEFLCRLIDYKVAICTASRFGYALRKIIEATACGCRVITDLPSDDILPWIDDNLFRVHPDASPADIKYAVDHCIRSYDFELQSIYSKRTLDLYDYRVEGVRLANAIEEMRRTYR